MNKTSRSTEQESNHKILLGSILSYVSIAFSIVMGLIYTPWMVHTIGQSAYGLYTLAVSLMSLFMFDFGINEAVSRFVAGFRAKREEEQAAKFVGVAFKLYLLIDCLLLIVGLAIFSFLAIIYQGLTAAELDQFRIVYVLVFGYNLIAFGLTPLTGVLSAYEEYPALKVCDLLNRCLTVVLVVLALYGGMDLLGVVGANIISGIAVLVVKVVLFKRRIPFSPNWERINRESLAPLVSFSVWTALKGIAGRFVFNVMPSILGIISNSASIAVFGAASTLEGYSYLICNALGGLFLPKISRIMSANNSSEALLDLSIKVGRILLAVTGLVFVGFVSIGSDFLLLWMGPDYLPAYGATIWMIFPALIYTPQNILDTAVVVKGHVKPQSFIWILTSLLNVLLSFLLCGRLGALGAGISIGVAYFIRSVANFFLYGRYLQIPIMTFVGRCYGRMAAVIVPALALGLLANHYFPSNTWLALLGKAIGVIIIYIILIFLFGVKPSELKNALQTVRRRGK